MRLDVKGVVGAAQDSAVLHNTELWFVGSGFLQRSRGLHRVSNCIGKLGSCSKEISGHSLSMHARGIA